MAKGYSGPSAPGCVCCHSGPKEKYYCQACDHVCKAPLGVTVTCPGCREPMLNMGHRWRPGPKGDRFRHYPEGFKIRVRVSMSVYPPVFRTIILGGHGYRLQQRERPLWQPGGLKMRDSRGRIRSGRTMA